MSCARVARASSTKTSRAGPGSTFGWPPRKRPTQSATRALAAAMTGVRKRGFIRRLRVARDEKAAIKASRRETAAASARSGPAAVIASCSNAQEPTQGQAAAERGDKHAGREEDRHEQAEVDRVGRGQQREAVG